MRQTLALFAAAALLLGLRALAEPSKAADFVTRHYHVTLDAGSPRILRLSVDSLGAARLDSNPVRAAERPPAAGWRSVARDRGLDYLPIDAPPDAAPPWSFSFADKAMTIRSRFADAAPTDPLVLRFDPKMNHAALLGLMPAAREISLPCLLHLPDLGTFRITADAKSVRMGYDARRFVDEPFVEITFPAATRDRPGVTYTLEVVAIHPKVPGVESDPRYDGFRRNFLNIFQLNPRLRVLANHAASDPAAFTVYKCADVAAAPGLPPLADGLNALDLVRATLDRYLAGMKGYGQVGYRRKMEDADTLDWASQFDALDALPSLLSAACTYATASGDNAWARRNWPRLREWTNQMLSTDRNQNGLLEYGLSGNSGSWSGNGDARPSNWWDQIGFGHEDAYANALAYRALVQLCTLASTLGEGQDAERWSAAARKLKAAYKPAFYNEKTGLLAGWRSADGQLHDYAFTFVTSCAVCWDLLDRDDADRMMTTLLDRLKAANYTNYRLGLPGNLLPIRRADYVTLKKRWGGPETEGGSDTFGVFENGGATHCFAYFTIKALCKLGRKPEARAILHPMLESFAAGDFQGRADDQTGFTKEWKDWQGKCWGYEGFLADGYLTLLAVMDDAR
jgi:hypothetical protein